MDKDILIANCLHNSFLAGIIHINYILKVITLIEQSSFFSTICIMKLNIKSIVIIVEENK